MFEKANPEQREAIECTEGPLLIIAGPGTGKTYTLINRIANLVINKDVPLSKILVTTFTVKAANEIKKRLADEFRAHGMKIGFDEMYIGTFHSICERILGENLRFTDLKKNFRVVDEFDRQYFIFRKLDRFRAIPGFEKAMEDIDPWKRCKVIGDAVDRLQEELVDPEDMMSSGDQDTVFYGRLLAEYCRLREEANILDYTAMQTMVYRLLSENEEVRNRLLEQIDYVMIDEYQDTNLVQEKLTLLFGSKKDNICVVGDEDQSLYRFRGATVRNILEFPEHFSNCRKVFLSRNYRSGKGIVDFYTKWIDNTRCKDASFEWGRSRNRKTIVPAEKNTENYPQVVRCNEPEIESLCEKVYGTLDALVRSGTVTDYNQVAFLFQSVRSDESRNLANYLAKKGIPVHAPRSSRFFSRKEIKFALGVLQLLFPSYKVKANSQAYGKYCKACTDLVLKEGDGELRDWIGSTACALSDPSQDAGYTFSGLIYMMMAFRPLNGYVERGLEGDLPAQGPARNLSMLVSRLKKFETGNEIQSVNARNSAYLLQELFLKYFLFQYENGVDEYEDDRVYAPKGHISFFTFHQAKGLEFPVVFVGSLDGTPRAEDNPKFSDVLAQCSERRPFEIPQYTKYYDFWRKYYVAFSRPQSLLVLTYRDSGRDLRSYFNKMYEGIPRVTEVFDIRPIEVKENELIQSYSYTADIRAYRECPVKYRLRKEFSFPESTVKNTMFGTLVHETLEDINREAIRLGDVDPEKIQGWLEENLATMRQNETTRLPGRRITEALAQCRRYAEFMKGRWDTVWNCEMPMSIVHGDLMLNGKMDLVLREGDSFIIVDYKTEAKPSPEDEAYQNVKMQLEIYAYLFEQRLGLPVGEMRAFYTGDREPVRAFRKDAGEIRKTVSEAENTIRLIQAGSFSLRCKDKTKCTDCDFRFFCGRN